MNEAVELLSRYLQIDTTNPPGNEDRGVKFFAEIFEKEKVEYKIYEAAPGRQSIRALIPGSGQKGALILLNHIDVVPAQMDQWSFEPFGGEVKDGFIHGLDEKISEENMIKGTEVYKDIVKKLCDI